MEKGISYKPAFLLLTLFSVYLFLLFRFTPSVAAPRMIEDQFAATLIVHIAALMPKNIQQLFVHYEKNLWDGYRFEQDRILRNQSVSEFNCIKEIDEKEATLIKWLQNYREAQTNPDYKLTRKMDRIVEEHGMLIKNIEHYYRENFPNTGDIILKFSNSDITVTYKGYNPDGIVSISNIIQKDVASLQKKPSFQVGDFYQTLLTSCMNSILYVHLKAGLKIDLASLANQTIKIDNKINAEVFGGGGASGYGGMICDGLYGLCLSICKNSSCRDRCGYGYSQCVDRARNIDLDEY